MKYKQYFCCEIELILRISWNIHYYHLMLQIRYSFGIFWLYQSSCNNSYILVVKTRPYSFLLRPFISFIARQTTMIWHKCLFEIVRQLSKQCLDPFSPFILKYSLFLGAVHVLLSTFYLIQILSRFFDKKAQFIQMFEKVLFVQILY